MNTPPPLISVIITAYNDEAYAARAIESVLNQTVKDFEILLIDNNSTDGTWAVFQAYQKKFPAFIHIFQESKQGCPAARNRGVREAKGEWIQILDSDDELLPQKLEHQLPLTKDENVQLIVGGRYKYKWVNNELQKKRKTPETENSWKALLLFRLGSTNSCLWRKKTVVDVNGWNESWTSVEDYEMFFRVMKNGVRPVFDPHTDAIVHMRDNSMSRSTNEAKMIAHIENAVRLRLMIRDYLLENGLLTPALKKEFSIDLYFKLLRWRPKVPQYIDKKMKELELKVPSQIKLKHDLHIFRRIVSKKIHRLIFYR